VWHKCLVKSLTEHLWFEVPTRRGFVNITQTVEGLVRKSGVQEGLCLVNAMHITASVFINDAEDGLLNDYDVWLEKLARTHPPPIPAQSHRRRQCRRTYEAPNHGPRSCGRHHQGKLDFAPGSRFSTANLMAAGASACS